MRLTEVLDANPVRKALLVMQQYVNDKHDDWDVKLIKDKSALGLRVTAKRDYRIEHDEEETGSVECVISDPPTDGPFSGKFDKSMGIYVDGSYVYPPVEDDWNSEEALEQAAEYLCRRVVREIMRDRPEAKRLKELKSMVEAHFERLSVSCPSKDGRTGIALMAPNSHEKLYVYAAKSSDNPTYDKAYGYVLGHGTALESRVRLGNFIELIGGVKRYCTKWVKEN